MGFTMLQMDIEYLDLSPDSILFGLLSTDWDGWGAKLQEARGKLDELEERVRTEPNITNQQRHSLFGKLHKKRQDWYKAREHAWSLALHDAKSLYKDALSAVNSIDYGESFRAVIEHFQSNQRTALSLYLERSDKHDIARMFQDLWDHMQKKMQKRRRKHEEERAGRKNEWINRQIDGLSRLRHSRSNVERRLDSIESNLQANEERLNSAYTEEFEERVRGWISQDETLLQETQESLNGLNRKITDAEEKLEDAKER